MTDTAVHLESGSSFYIKTRHHEIAYLTLHYAHGAKSGHTETDIPPGYFKEYQRIFNELGITEANLLIAD